jgi:hypothetical protein
MKTRTLFLLLAAALSIKTFAQAPNPDCNTLLVSQVQMDTDTADLMKVTIKNTCSNCATGFNGCVYLEMKVIRTVAPFDTIAATNCFCHYHAPNGGQRTYLLFDSQVTTLPPLAQLRVSIPFCGCDTVPFEAGLVSGLGSDSYLAALSLLRLNANEYELNGLPVMGNFTVIIRDIAGKTLGGMAIQAGRATVNLSSYAPGIYLVEVRDNHVNTLRTFKVIKY